MTDRNYCTESLPTNDFTSDPVLPNVHMQQMLGGTVDPQYPVSPSTYDHSAVPYGGQYTDPLMMSSCMQINTDNVSKYNFAELLSPHTIVRVGRFPVCVRICIFCLYLYLCAYIFCMRTSTFISSSKPLNLKTA